MVKPSSVSRAIDFSAALAAGGVGVEVDHDLRGVALEDGHLLLGKGRSAGGDHVLNAAQKDGDAIHLALDEQGKLMLADGGLRLVQIEEDQALGIERRLRRVDVLGARLVAGFEGARGEGDHAAALVGNGKHHALAEAVVDVSQRPIALLLRAEQPADARSVSSSAMPLSRSRSALKLSGA